MRTQLGDPKQSAPAAVHRAHASYPARRNAARITPATQQRAPRTPRADAPNRSGTHEQSGAEASGPAPALTRSTTKNQPTRYVP